MIESSPGKGTVIRLNIPVAFKEENDGGQTE